MGPTTHQELFLAYIAARSTVIGEFSGDIRGDGYRLRKWAVEYARRHSLLVPNKGDAYGLYYSPDEDEIRELTAAGLYDPALEYDY